MKYSSKIGLAAALGFALTALGPAQAADKQLTILMSVPGLIVSIFRALCWRSAKRKLPSLAISSSLFPMDK